MTIESDFTTTVGALCSSRVYPDTAPHDTTRPYVVYSQVGGQVVSFLEGGAAVKRNARIQVNVWADTRQAANVLMRQIEDALQSSPYYGEPQGALISRLDEQTQCRGAQQDFSLWWS